MRTLMLFPLAALIITMGALQVAAQSPPTITSQPQSRTNCPNTTVTFSVTAGGVSPLSYRWRFNTVTISGATNFSYTLTSVQLSNAGIYSVVVTNILGSAISSNAVLTVNTPTTATGPASLTRCPGQLASFGVTASGTGPFTYQWSKN